MAGGNEAGARSDWWSRAVAQQTQTRETGVPEGTIRRWIAELTHEQPTRGMLTGYLWEAALQGGITQGQARAMRILQRILMDDDLPDVDALDELLGDG